MADLATTLQTYFTAWNEPDAASRAGLLAGVVAEDVRVLPGYMPQAPPVVGLRPFAEHMGTIIASRPSPDVRLALEGGADQHHGWARFAWRVLLPDGTTYAPSGLELTGLDVVRLDPDGRFGEIIIFLGQAPSSAAVE